MVGRVEGLKQLVSPFVIRCRLAKKPTHKVLVARVANGKENANIPMLSQWHAQLAPIPDPLFANGCHRVISKRLNGEGTTLLLSTFAHSAHLPSILTQIILRNQARANALSLQNGHEFAQAAMTIDSMFATQEGHTTQ